MLDGFQHLSEGWKFKLDCVESKNSYILLIDAISFKLRLINLVYIFSKHPVFCSLTNKNRLMTKKSNKSHSIVFIRNTYTEEQN